MEGKNYSKWYYWTRNAYVKYVEYLSVEYGHKYIEFADLINECILITPNMEKIEVIKRKGLIIKVSNYKKINKMKTYEYNMQNCRKIIKKDYLNTESVEEAHEKLIKDFSKSIIWIDGIRFSSSC